MEAMTAPLPSIDSPRKQPTPIVIAWCLCYAWGIALLVPTVVILIPLVSKPRTFMSVMAFLSIVLIIGIAYCVGGYLIHRRRRSAPWFTAVLVLLTSALQLAMHLNFEGVNMKAPWLIVNALLLILLLTNWRRLRNGRQAVGA